MYQVSICYRVYGRKSGMEHGELKFRYEYFRTKDEAEDFRTIFCDNKMRNIKWAQIHHIPMTLDQYLKNKG